MSALPNIEEKLNEVLVKNAPVQLPENIRKWIATYAWAFSLIGCVFGVFTILPLLAILGVASVFVTTTVVGAGHLVLFSWIALLVLIGYVVLLGIATPKLKRLEKSGWDLIFYSAIFFLVYDIVGWLQYPRIGAFFGLLWQLAWAVVGFYFIFQVRSYFKNGGATKAATPVKSTSTKSKK